MVKLTANNQIFEGLDSQAIKYTKQITDVFDLAVISSSYTNGFKIPKTPHNTQIMQGLGIIGDTSTIPYQKVPSTLSKSGFTLFKNGWLSVSATDEEYNVSCIDGMIDFFKAIENRTMGTDLDLINFSHIKDLPSVLASFSNDYYKYIIADYNGKNIGLNGGTEGINIDYLVPMFNMGKLFELIMSTFGYNYIDTNISEINDLWISYPKPPQDTITDELSASMRKDAFNTSIMYPLGNDYWSVQPTLKVWSSSVINEGNLLGNWRYEIEESSPYRIEISTEMYALYRWTTNYNRVEYKPMYCNVTVNNNSIIWFESDPFDVAERMATLYLNAGDVLEFKFFATPFEYGQNIFDPLQKFRLREIRHNGTDLKVYKTNQGNVNLSDAFKDYLIKDFVKEVFWRTSVTPVIDTLTNTMTFVSLNERLDFARSIDWSAKYIKRTKESYTQGSYAQKNSFSHRYNDEDDISQNGYLYIANLNLEDSKVLVQSKIYAPELITYEFPEGIKTNKFTVWQRETKEDANGDLSIEYKGLNGRFFIVKIKTTPIGSYKFVSEAVPGIDAVTQYPYADTTGTTYDQIVPIKYGAYAGVLNNFRAHDIQLALNENDILGLDLTRPVYFKQEGMNYILNRITYSEGDILTGEFIRINKVVN